MARGGGVPVGLGGDGQAEELQNVEKKLARGLVGGEDERRRGSAWRWFDGKQRWAAALLNDGKKGSSALRSEGGEAKTKSASTYGLSGDESSGTATRGRGRREAEAAGAEEEMELMAVS